MNTIKDTINTAGMVGSMAWTTLSFITNGHPAAALVLVAFAGAWFGGIWVIVGSFI